MAAESPVALDQVVRRDALLGLWKSQEEIGDPRERLSSQMKALKDHMPEELDIIHRVLEIEHEYDAIREITATSSFGVTVAVGRLEQLARARDVIRNLYEPGGQRSQLKDVFTTGLQYAQELARLEAANG